MNIQIQIDPSQAVAAAGNITQAVATTEATGARAGKTITTAMQEAAAAMDKARTGAKSYSDGLDLLGKSGNGGGLAEQFEREAAMLQKINGPLQEYTANLRALDSLLSKESITTGQYADQVTRLNQALAKAPVSSGGAPALPSIPGAAASAAGSAGGGDPTGGALGALASSAGGAAPALAGLATGGMAVGAAFVGAALAAIELSDSYAKLTNSVVQFATSQTSTDDIVRQSYEIAGNMNASLAETTALYAKLRVGTDDLNISGDQYARMTQTLGEAAKLSGKDIDDAQAIVQRLGFALENGGIKGRELKSMMRDMPALGDLWTESMGKSRAQLIAMADNGTLDLRTLESTLVSAGDTMDQKFTKRVETAGEAWQHFKDGLLIDQDPSKFTQKQLDLVNNFNPYARGGHNLTGGSLDPDEQAAKDQAQQTASLGKFADDATTKLKLMGQALSGLGTNQDPWNGLKSSAGGLITTLTDINNALYKSAMAPEGAAVHDYFTGLDTAATAARDKVDMLNAAVAKLMAKNAAPGGGLPQNDDQLTRTTRERDDAMRDLAKTTTSYGATAAQVAQQDVTHARTLQDTVMAYRAGAISGREYGDEMTKLGDEDLARSQSEVTHAVKSVTDAFIAGRTSAAQYAAAIGAVDAQAGIFSEQFKLLTAINTPMAEYLRQSSALQDVEQKISGSQYATEFQKIQKAFEDQSGITAKYEAMKALEEQLSGVEKHSGAAAEALEKLQKTQLTIDSAVQKNARTPEQGDAAMSAFRAQQQKELTAGDQTPAQKYQADRSNLDAEHAPNSGGSDRTLITDQQYAVALTNLQERYTTIRTPLEDYQLAEKKLQEQIATGLPSSAAQGQALADLHDKYTLLKTPAEEYAEALRKVAQESSNGLSSAEGIEDALRKTRESFGDGTFADGITDGFKQIKSQVLDTAGTIKTEMVDAFNAVNSSLTDLITTGTTDWKKMMTGMERDLVGGALKSAEGGIAGALGISNGPAAGGAALTGSASALTSAAGALTSAAGALSGAGAAGAGDSLGGLGLGFGSLGGGGTGADDFDTIGDDSAGAYNIGAAAGPVSAGDFAGLPTPVPDFYRSSNMQPSGYGATQAAPRQDRSGDKGVTHLHVHMDPKEIAAAMHPHLQDLVKTEVIRQSATSAMARSKR